MAEMKRFIEFMGAASLWMAMGALTAGMQSGLAIWQERRHRGHDNREIGIYKGEGSREFTRGVFRNE